MDRLQRKVLKVVARGNCSGCGACALLSKRVTMALSDEGYMRPVVDASETRSIKEAKAFDLVCPGVQMERPEVPSGGRVHELFGPYLAAFEGVATDVDIRQAGSSGGVLTALSKLLAAERDAPVLAAGKDPDNALRTVPLVLTAEVVEQGLGSRYAPVATLEMYKTGSYAAVSAKPCEASALRSIRRQDPAGSEEPILSFFCAGTPSQDATNELVRMGPGNPSEVVDLRYRGDGWPGDFVARYEDGGEVRKSYEESWGTVLGRNLQWRCKICPDGVGMDADVVVGDYWQADADGYPSFENSAGNSVVIARTPVGLSLLERAVIQGCVNLTEVDLDDVARMQPLQRDRSRALRARQMGRLLAGFPAPRFKGYAPWSSVLRDPVRMGRATIGTLLRSRKTKGRSVGNDELRDVR